MKKTGAIISLLLGSFLFACTHGSIDGLTNTNTLSVRASISGNILALSWDKTNDVQSYVIEIKNTDTNKVILRTVLPTQKEYSEALPEGNYQVQVLVKKMTGEESEPSIFPITQKIQTQATRPSQPSTLTSTNENIATPTRDIRLSWTAAAAGKKADGGSSAIKEYIVYWNEGSTVDTKSLQTQKVVAKQGVVPTTITLQPLQAFAVAKTYSFIVVAVNEAGLYSLPSSINTVMPITTPGAPTALSSKDVEDEDKSRTIVLSWKAPTNAGKNNDGSDSNIKEYRVYWAEGETVSQQSHTQRITAKTKNVVNTTYTLATTETAGIFWDKKYTFFVIAVNDADRESSQSSDKIIAASQVTAPGSPTNVKVNTTGLDVAITWAAPTQTGTDPSGTAVAAGDLQYIVHYRKTGETAWQKRTAVTALTDTVTVEVKKSYQFAVLAKTPQGMEGSLTAPVEQAALTPSVLGTTATVDLSSKSIERFKVAVDNAGKTIGFIQEAGNLHLIDLSNDSTMDISTAPYPLANLNTDMEAVIGGKFPMMKGVIVNPTTKQIYVLGETEQAAHDYVGRLLRVIPKKTASDDSPWDLEMMPLSAIKAATLTTHGQINDFAFGKEDNTLYVSITSRTATSLAGKIAWVPGTINNGTSITTTYANMRNTLFVTGSSLTATPRTTAPVETLSYVYFNGKGYISGINTCSPGFSIATQEVTKATSDLSLTQAFNLVAQTPLGVFHNSDSTGKVYLFSVNTRNFDQKLEKIDQQYIDGTATKIGILSPAAGYDISSGGSAELAAPYGKGKLLVGKDSNLKVIDM